MKYKYNNEWNDLEVKVSDTLPVGTIVDYDGDTVPDGYEQVNSYSTDEVKTGDTWIDGKPIYRKVIARNLNVTNGTNVNLSSLNINELIKVKSINKKTDNNFVFFDNFFDSSNEKITLHYRDNLIEAWTGTGISYISTIWIEYTKTTD